MSARDVALATVRDVFAAEDARARSAQASLDYHLAKKSLDDRDRGLATELAYGAIKMRRLLDWYLQPYIGTRGKQLPPSIHEILRLAIYELRFLRSAHHAVVHDWVGLAKTHGHRGTAGLVNAVLRSFLRDERQPPAPADFSNADEYLATAYSYPTWIVRSWRSRFGPERLEELLAGANGPSQTSVTINTMARTVQAALEELSKHNVTAQPSPFVEETVIIEGRLLPQSSDAKWFVQSESAAMPVAIENPQPGEKVLDLCSGRGNKALQTAIRMQGEGTLTCIERDQRRVEILQARLQSAGLHAALVNGEADSDIVPGPFDRVLLDAPCSGLGVIGRYPEARWRKSPQDPQRLAQEQAALISCAAQRVYPGGVLVYAVCSTDEREGPNVVENFLAERRDFSRGLIGAALEPFIDEAGDVVIPPGIDGRDGFYIARLERAS